MKILLAEDDAVLRCLLEELLTRWGHTAIVAEDGDEAAACVARGEPFDIAILDWMMPGASGPNVCRLIREHSTERRPFVLMLTAKSQLDDVVEGLDAGADEYLTKPYRPAELAARLRAAERLMRMQDELIEARRLVAYQATHDLETGALNRGALINTLHRLVTEQGAVPSPISLVRVDVGGRPGTRRVRLDDELLKGVVERVAAAAGPRATVGRTADAELLVVFPEADESEGHEHARAIADAVNSTPIGPVTVRIETSAVTAQTATEMDLTWLLCAVDALPYGRDSFAGARTAGVGTNAFAP
jgi:two-component system chemotaxis response regulator CheY